MLSRLSVIDVLAEEVFEEEFRRGAFVDDVVLEDDVVDSSAATSFDEYETVIVGRVGRGVGDRFLLTLDRPDSEDGLRGLPDEGGEREGEDEADGLWVLRDSAFLTEIGGGRDLEWVKRAANLDASDDGGTVEEEGTSGNTLLSLIDFAFLFGKGGAGSLNWRDDGDGKGGSGEDLRRERPRKGILVRLLLIELPPVDDPDEIGRVEAVSVVGELVSWGSLSAEREECTLLRKKPDKSEVLVRSLRLEETSGVDMRHSTGEKRYEREGKKR
jgi:hypothetical protein